MWLGEQITARGIGNGISLIIFAGIVANLPQALAGTLELGRTGALSAAFIVLLLLMAGCCDCVHSIHRTIPKKNYSSVS
jgi:preprotein translocase subunit SecY